MAKVDSQFQEQMSQASATLDGVDRAEGGGGGGGRSVVSSVVGGAEKNRDLAVMAASDSAKVREIAPFGRFVMDENPCPVLERVDCSAESKQP